MPGCKAAGAGRGKKEPAGAKNRERTQAGGLCRYLARSRCRVGRMRDKGEVFEWTAFEACPSYLELLGPAGVPELESAAPVAGICGRKAGASAEDMGIGPARPVRDLNSADFIRRRG